MVETSTPFSTEYATSTAVNKYVCEGYCKHGECTLTGPGGTAVCSCHGYTGTRCEEPMYFIELFRQLREQGLLPVFCSTVVIAVIVLAAVILYRRHRLKKSSEKYNQSSLVDGISSKDELLMYHVTQPDTSSSKPPTPISPKGQGICYLIPTESPSEPEVDAWQDYHNPGYRQSYIDSVV